MMLTLRPRLSSRQPMEAAASPLPNDETTPPVTKMYLAGMPAPLVMKCGVNVSAVQPSSLFLTTGHWRLTTVFRGCCAPEGNRVGLAPAGVHDLLYRNSGVLGQTHFATADFRSTATDQGPWLHNQ